MKRKLWFVFACLLLMILSFAACTQEAEPVFSQPETQPASIPAETGNPEEAQVFEKTGEFFSSDGTVQFIWKLSGEKPEVVYPIIDVIPHDLTDQEAERIASVLFEGAVFYEAEDSLDAEYSKAELQKKLDIWALYATPEAYTMLYPYRMQDDESYAQEKAQLVQKFIDEYTAKLEEAPDEKLDPIYDWVFRMDGDFGKGYRADCEFGGIPYRITSNGKNCSAYISTRISPSSIEEAHYRAVLCRTEKPGQEQLDAIRAKAEAMIQAMNLGDWHIDACEVKADNLGSEEAPVWEYSIDVTALPSFIGYNTMAWSAGNRWAQEGMDILFAPNGELLSFYFPMVYDFDSFSGDEMGLSLEELMPMAENALINCSFDDFGMFADWFTSLKESKGENIICKAEICDMRYGLLMGKHPSYAGKMQLVPSVILEAAISYCGETTGTVYLTEEENFGTATRRILALNTLDGSEIAYPY